MKTLLSLLMVILLLAGCASGTVKEQNQTETLIRQHDRRLSTEYLHALSTISGRLDGMNKAMVDGLTESLDTARISRKLAEEAVATANENRRILQELVNQVKEQEESQDAASAEEDAADNAFSELE